MLLSALRVNYPKIWTTINFNVSKGNPFWLLFYSTLADVAPRDGRNNLVPFVWKVLSEWEMVPSLIKLVL